MTNKPAQDKRDTVIKETVAPTKSLDNRVHDAKYVTSTAIGNVSYPTYVLLNQDDMDCTKLVVGDKVSLKTADLILTGEFVKLAGIPLVNIVLDKVQAKANIKPLNKGL
ncbi:MAG: hypothetical protein K0U41_05385 [Gammaproteobacteria bacterium]|nr:hypothetical protein [Gammaproteobacteria bacterium]